CSQSYNLFLIQLVFCIHSHKETFTILHLLFTNFSHSSIIFFIIIIIECYHYSRFLSLLLFTLSICSSITLYMFLAMTSHSHNKHHCSAYIRQFISKYTIINNISSLSSYTLLIISFSA
ncbi:hypothetical protein BDDG_13628, partial [Blastomyces dermatitidis ATCC 18188]